MGLEAEIWAWRLEAGGGGYKEEEGEEGENSYMCESFRSSTPLGLLPKKGLKIIGDW